MFESLILWVGNKLVREIYVVKFVVFLILFLCFVLQKILYKI